MHPDAIRQLMVELLRSGVVEDEAIERAAVECEAEGQGQAAHELRCLIVRANSSRTSEWARAKADARAAERRSRLKPVDGGKGG